MIANLHQIMRPGERLPAYIGDGVYTSFDGYHIWLRTEKDGMVHEIALEPDVWRNLKEYIAHLQRVKP